MQNRKICVFAVVGGWSEIDQCLCSFIFVSRKKNSSFEFAILRLLLLALLPIRRSASLVSKWSEAERRSRAGGLTRWMSAPGRERVVNDHGVVRASVRVHFTRSANLAAEIRLRAVARDLRSVVAAAALDGRPAANGTGDDTCHGCAGESDVRAGAGTVAAAAGLWCGRCGRVGDLRRGVVHVWRAWGIGRSTAAARRARSEEKLFRVSHGELETA
jgi:hypothetical protein